MAIDAVLGGGFGALAHVHAKLSDIDATLTANEARSIDGKAPGLSATPEAANAHVETLYRAMDSLLNDEPATVALSLSERPGFSPELIALAGNRMSRGDRLTLEQQRADIEYKLNRFDNEALLSGYTKQDFIDQARAEQPRAPARKVAALADEMVLNAKQNDRADLQTVLLDTIHHRLSRDDEYRAAYAELSRIEQGYWRENGFIRSAPDEVATAEPDARAVISEQSAPAQPLKVAQVEPMQPAGDTTGATDQAAQYPETANPSTAPDQGQTRNVSPEIDAARQWLDSHGDKVLTYLDDDGTERQACLRDLLTEVDNDLADLDKLDAATQAAVNCFLKFGDHT